VTPPAARTLGIATADNVLAPANGSRYRLEAREIRDLVQQPKEAPWAVVLNACTSAATSAESGARSLAASLVRDHGLQVVVGMREPVLSTDAARFTDAFYRSLLAEVHRHVASGARDAEFDWASFTVGARAQLCQNRSQLFQATAARCKEWILPVVTVRPAPFKVEVVAPPSTNDSEVARLIADFKATLLANLPSTTPAGTVAAFASQDIPAGSASPLRG